ncbi:hypothetical protein B7463_g2704, partial [Scytalidium lignicola]
MDEPYLPSPAIPANIRTYGGNAAFHNFHNDYSHITDPNLRRRLALSEIDKVPFGWYHVRAVVVAGIGFFTDSYDIFAINLITSMLGMVFWQDSKNLGVMSTSANTAIKAATSGGAVIGQVGFGWLSDIIGRRKMYGVELAIIVFATLAQSLAAPSPSITITGLLIFWRIIMGIGIGGDYPLSAVITSEFAPTRWRGAMMAAVFSMQGAGQFAAALVALVATYAFRSSFINTTSDWSSCDAACQVAGDRAWRIIVGFGALPACFALYYRITIPETPRYTFDVAHDIEKADADIKAYMNNEAKATIDPITQHRTKATIGNRLSVPTASWPDCITYFRQWQNAKVLIGTTSSWFFLDLAYYGLQLNNSTVLDAIGYSTGKTIYETLLRAAIGNLVLSCAGAIPGYWVSVATIDTVGRKPIQVFGFFILTILFCIIGFAYSHLSEGALLALYVLAQFFFNFGPNTTTFIIPGECFPTRYRSTGHGLSAGAGKIGAIIAQVIAPPLLAKGSVKNCSGSDCSPWLNHLMQIFALFMLSGTLVSLLVPETSGRTLEELAGEGRTPLDEGASRNNSVTMPGSKRRWFAKLNPFGGGRPAGFMWTGNGSPRSSPMLKAMGFGRRERVGIMTSPELLPKDSNPRKSGKHGRGGSDTSESAGGYSVSVTSNPDDFYFGGGTLPGWGAGWAVQRNPGRNGQPGRVQSIKLQDVGSLLK